MDSVKLQTITSAIMDFKVKLVTYQQLVTNRSIESTQVLRTTGKEALLICFSTFLPMEK